MASCFIARENICAYIDNELGTDEKRSFEEHIRDCKDCRRELDEMKRITRLCNELPQFELPPGFKAELHEKLLAVAGGRDKIEKSGRRNKIFFLSRTFASIAAGILLIFLVGGIIRLSLHSPKITVEGTEQRTNMVMEAVPEEGEVTAAGVEEHHYDVQESEKAYSAKGLTNHAITGKEVESTDTNRSATVSDIKGALPFAPEMAEEESAFNRMSTITILVEDPRTTVETVMTLAFENSGELVGSEDEKVSDVDLSFYETADAGFSQEAEPDTGEAAIEQIILVFPCTNYDAFVEAVSGLFGEANVRISALVTEDLTGTLNELIAESARIDNNIRELQKGNNAGSSEIDELEKEKEIVDGQIENIRLGSDYVTVTVNINNK
jgi:hypothetical protein